MCDGKSCGCGNNQGGCGGGRMGCGWNYRALLWVLVALIVSTIIFCTGFTLGMLRSYFVGGEYGHGRYMMYRGDVREPGMMGNWQVNQVEQGQPATNTTK
jgi:hypothetical protein